MKKVTISVEIEVETDMDARKIQTMVYRYCDDMATDIMSIEADYPSIDVVVYEEDEE